ncbi:TRAP transporter small permease subunit [Acuticoccus sp. M5D2P5]|uniref:TRAP transporter small permease n=1 Tax=Acuticoccus kalidii TaxID=2910977 RepID=UPI001F2E06E2|nr:TRAP transporter small permease subunit [Acuticoccus kalidii]MCF3933257.1 TRAP transporter small permease subunit [Acuticoccus kalidii]
MTGVLRWADRLAAIFAGLAAILAILMAGFVMLSAIMRYLVGSPFAFTEELVGLLFTAMIFVGLPVCTMRRAHISVTIVPDLLKGAARRNLDRIAYALILVFCIWFGTLTLEYLETTLALDARSAGSRLILWPWTAVLPVSCLLSGLAAALRIIEPGGAHTIAEHAHRGAE